MVTKYLIFIIAFTISPSAFAYLDPGTGSLIIQSILAAIAGAIVAIKYYWHKILFFIKRNQPNNSDDKKDDDIES
ncbi:MAG: hypothetical protein GTO02_13860 [Candidatus Dadabacteria bacterium]|nr:hypothetical protein [Candidatus Dadabacteria bacterium]